MSSAHTRPRGMVIIFVLIVIVALGALSTMATSPSRTSNQYLDIHEQMAQAQFAADSALEETLAGLNSKGLPFLADKHAQFTLTAQTSSDEALTLLISAGNRTLAVQLAKQGPIWKLASYRIDQ